MMKLKLLPVAISSIIAAQCGVANAAEVQVYGKVNVTTQVYDNEYFGMDQKENEQLNSNASRVGVKGDLNISEDLKAVYKLEYDVFVDDGSDNNLGNTSSDTATFKARNMYGGLKSVTWGQLVAGKHDTPFKLIQNSDLDRFNDLDQGDMKNYLVGEDRVNNMVMYTTPVLSSFTGNIQLYTAEESGVSTGPSTPNTDDQFTDHVSTSITYDAGGPFYAGIAYNNDVENADAWRVMASYKIGPVQIAGLLQTAKVHDDDNDHDGNPEERVDGIIQPSGSLKTILTGTANNYSAAVEKQDAYMANVKWTIVPDKWAVYGQIGHSNNTFFNSTNMGNAADAEIPTTFYGVGVDRYLSKKVMVFGYYTHQNVDIDNDSALVVTSMVDDADLQTAGIGLEIKF